MNKHTIKTTVFLTSMSDFAECNAVYAKYFAADCLPARSCVAVKELPMGAIFEVEAVFFKPWLKIPPNNYLKINHQIRYLLNVSYRGMTLSNFSTSSSSLLLVDEAIFSNALFFLLHSLAFSHILFTADYKGCFYFFSSWSEVLHFFFY